jgi:thiamine biosynthesis lipoprotein ApbE
MATALMVLGPKDGYNLAVKEQLAALLIIRKDEEFIEKATPAFEQWLEEQTTK